MFLKVSFFLFLPSVILTHVEDILAQRGRRYWKVVFIGLHCSRMHTYFASHVIIAKEKITYPIKIKLYYKKIGILICFVEFL